MNEPITIKHKGYELYTHQYNYEIIDLDTAKRIFVNRLPAKNTKYWKKEDFLIWDLKNNCSVTSED